MSVARSVRSVYNGNRGFVCGKNESLKKIPYLFRPKIVYYMHAIILKAVFHWRVVSFARTNQLPLPRLKALLVTSLTCVRSVVKSTGPSLPLPL